MKKTMENTNVNVTINDSKAARAEMIINTTSELWGKRIAIIPIDLLDVDYSYQRVRTAHVNYIYDNWKQTRCDFLEVSYRDGIFYIIDGQHRYYAALAKGIKSLPCIIKTGMTMEDEARDFVEKNTGYKSLTPFDTFKANIANGNENIPDVKVDMTIKRVCDKYGVEVKKVETYGTIPKILRSLTRARDIVKSKNLGEECLDWILKTVTESKWSECQEAYRSYTMDMLRNFYSENIENIETETKKIERLMNRFSPIEMLEIAREYRGKYNCGLSSALSMVLKDLI
jgi:hypothetical protein